MQAQRDLVRAGLVAALLGGLLAGCGPASPPAPPPAFVLVGVNPHAAGQPTERGRVLHTVVGWRGRVYTGYGDYDRNTGPVAVSAWHPGPQAFTALLAFPSEAIEVYRTIGERLYAPAIDPRGDGPSATLAIGEPDGRWWNNRALHLTHAFDVATLDGRDLWVVGSRGRRALAARSLDGGLTWRVELALLPRGQEEDFARFYFALVHRGRLHLQAEDAAGGPHPRSRIWTGGDWVDGPDLGARPGTVARPVAFGDRVVYLGREGLAAFDGRAARPAGVPGARDLVVAGGALYVLDGRRVLVTRDLAGWTVVAPAPPGAASLGALDGRLYLGTERSELYRLDRPLAALTPAGS